MFRDLLEWWKETLGTPLRRLAGQPGDALQLVLRKKHLEIVQDGKVRVVSLDAEDFDNQPRDGLNGSAVLALEASRYILRSLSPVRLPASRARAMATLDLAAATPFPPADTYCLILKPVARDGPVPTVYAIVKKSLIDPVLERLRSGSAPLAGIVLLSGTEPEAPIWQVSSADLARLTGAPSTRQRTMFIAAAALTAAVIGTVLHVQWTYASAQASIDERLPPLEAKARELRDELNRRAARVAEVAALRQSLSTQRPMSEVLEEISRVVPDTAYLTDLAVKNGEARMVGFSSSASSLIAPVESSPMFDGAEFTSPVVRTPGYDGERFEMKFKVLNR